MDTQSRYKRLIPGVKKKNLLLVMAIFWSFAGAMLLFRGFSMIFKFPENLFVKISASFFMGALFYYFMFRKIVLKHTKRILSLENERPCIFSFFNLRSYFLMLIMMFMGISIRKSGIVSMQYLSVFYLIMGIPLIVSAVQFYFFRLNYLKIYKKLM